jgi:molecular chaperone DnaJ
MPTTQRNYYETLGIPRTADEKTIKNAFRKLALQYHPDRNKDPGAEERFKEIAEAYAVLSDTQKRAAYDAGGREPVMSHAPEDVFGGIDFSTLFGGLGFDFGGGGLFDRFFRQGRRTRLVKGDNLEVVLEIPLERVRVGGEEIVRLTRSSVCPACQGSGAEVGTRPRRCSTCGGSGQTLSRWREGGMTLQRIIACPTCHGRGTVVETRCTLCKGHGEVESADSVRIALPVGLEEGMVLRVPGHGQASRTPGGPPGDLFVAIHIAPDTRFERRGADLWRTETIPVVDSVLGTRLEVPTLEGPTMVTIPPGTQPETVLRLRHKGLPEFGGDGQGDLYLRVRVEIPERLTPAERHLYEQLRQPHAAAPSPSPTTVMSPSQTSWWQALRHTVGAWLRF